MQLVFQQSLSKRYLYIPFSSPSLLPIRKFDEPHNLIDIIYNIFNNNRRAFVFDFLEQFSKYRLSLINIFDCCLFFLKFNNFFSNIKHFSQ